MPIQNVGTLLENLMVTEAAFHLFTRCADSGETLEFVNAFAMPPLSEWRPNAQNAGFNDVVFDKLLGGSDAAIRDAGAYPQLLRRVLTYDRRRGPNAALLVLGAWGQQNCAAPRLWLNDIRDGRYGDAVAPLTDITGDVAAAGLVESSRLGSIAISVCEEPYPDSLHGLSSFIAQSKTPRARLAFLDPMRYRIRNRRGPETSSNDHRDWLRTIAFDGLSIALHFTGNNDHRTRNEEVASLLADALAEGYAGSRVFTRQHYAVLVAVRDVDDAAAAEVAAVLESRICRAWQQWFAAFTDVRNNRLGVQRSCLTV